MKTVGEILAAARKKKHLSINEISRHTKIQPQFIIALEKNDYKNLPESTFVKGFISNIAPQVGKDPKTLLAIFRRDYAQDARGKVIPRGLVDPLNQPRFRWTPRTTAIASFTLVMVLFISYLIFQFRLLTGVPKLHLDSPQDNQTLSTQIEVKGTTHPQATITINGDQAIVDENGNFSENITLTPGQHTLTVESRSRTNKTKTIQRSITVE